MLHRTAKLTPAGRLLLVRRVLEEGWPPATAAEMLGVSRATAYKWLRRFREEGRPGLDDRSSRPRTRPRDLPAREVRRILLARGRLRVGPHRLGPLLGHPRSTVYGVLRRHGRSRLAHADLLTGTQVRYVRERPGELVHVDVKRLGRVPPGGGHLHDGLGEHAHALAEEVDVAIRDRLADRVEHGHPVVGHCGLPSCRRLQIQRREDDAVAVLVPAPLLHQVWGHDLLDL